MTEDDRRLPRPTVRLATPALQLSVPCVSKRFAATQAFQDVSLDLIAGEIRGLVGENGAGKSRSSRCSPPSRSPRTAPPGADPPRGIAGTTHASWGSSWVASAPVPGGLRARPHASKVAL